MDVMLGIVIIVAILIAGLVGTYFIYSWSEVEKKKTAVHMQQAKKRTIFEVYDRNDEDDKDDK